MSLMGIDVGTTGCKASVFSAAGALLGGAYREYDVNEPAPGRAELPVGTVWDAVRTVIAEAVAAAGPADPVSALCVSSLGEAVVPVTEDRRWLADSMLNYDERGAEYLPALAESLPDDYLYPINGNTLGNHYSLTKLLWIREHQPEVYEKTFAFLHWAPFVGFMLGAEPRADYCLANRTLLFDIRREDWSEDLARRAGADLGKLPPAVPSGTVTGEVSPALARELGLPPGVAIVSGAHDQCANGIGAGVLSPGRAMLGMGTYICLMPVFATPQDPAVMARNGLNTEHHAVPGRFVSFLYNHGGGLVKWHRDTFARAEREQARSAGNDLYAALSAEMPEGPSGVFVLPHFAPTGPPEFVSDSSGVMTGLRLGTTRGEILKGIQEGTLFYIKDCAMRLPDADEAFAECRAVGGGSNSDVWMQTAADIFNRPITCTKVAEAGTLGGAILAGAATGVFASAEEGADAMVGLDRVFEPDPARAATYAERFAKYQRLWPLLRDFLRD
jgi:xylulokinase